MSEQKLRTILEVQAVYGSYTYKEDEDGNRKYGYMICPRCKEPVTPCVPDCCELAFHHDEEINAKCESLSVAPDEDDTILTADCITVHWPDEEQDIIHWYLLFEDYAHWDWVHERHIQNGVTDCHCALYIKAWPEDDSKVVFA